MPERKEPIIHRIIEEQKRLARGEKPRETSRDALQDRAFRADLLAMDEPTSSIGDILDEFHPDQGIATPKPRAPRRRKFGQRHRD